MVPGDTSAIAVVAEYIGSIVTILLGHWLFFDVPVKSTELTLHVGDTFRTNRTLVAGVAPLGETRLMDAVTTAHEGDWLVGGKHVLTTYRAVALGTSFNAFVCAFCLDRHTSGACF